ncbi:hypothetical protein [Enterococcus sp. AZ163]|uniref:hypothetical protein n=1 Tax=Enterococcus sp. AZ163 TaxID=2774638 RepID=UPI003D2D6DBF
MAELGQLILEVIKNLGMRKLILILFITVTFITFLKQRLKKHRSYDELDAVEDSYQKDENGLYPWEADTDDSPQRIPEDAKKYIHNAGPKRGRWS